jgi:cell division protein ZapA
MVNVTVKFNNHDYILSCEDGQEKELEKLANHLNDRYEKLKTDLGNIGENKLLIINAIQLIDEVFTIKTSIEKFRNQNKDLINRFKEIKNLSILYKEDKEKEIQHLHSELSDLKDKILDNEKNYSESLEKVSNSINKFLENIN